MGGSPVAGSRPNPPPSAVEQARRLLSQAEGLEAHHDRQRYVEGLKGYLAFVEHERKPLEEAASEVAGRLDEVAMALYRLSEADLAARATDLGLQMAPGSSSLLHHKALILLALNRDVEQVLPLLDGAIAANPHDKAIWATKGDALRLMNRPQEAAEAYLRAQQLDAASMQYVERALKLAPSHPAALRMKLQLARAHGGDRQALEADEALLLAAPDDVELLIARAELLAELGEAANALSAVEVALRHAPQDGRAGFLKGRLLIANGRGEEAKAQFRTLLKEPGILDVHQLAELADMAEAEGSDPVLALEVRENLRTADPRNLANLGSIRRLATQLDRPEVAIAACKTILETSPENLEAMRALAELLIASGHADEGFDEYRRLVEAHPRELTEVRKALDAARGAGRTDLVELFARAIASESDEDTGSRQELAHALAAKGDKEGALAELDALLKIDPTNAADLAMKRDLLTELGRKDDLPAVYDQLFQIDPTRSDIALERGNLYLHRAFDLPEGSGDRESSARAALVSYERASIDPELAGESLLGLARASRLVGDADRAVKAYQEFLARPGTEKRSDILKELGHALRELHRLSEAEQAYSQAIQLGLEEPDLFWGEVEVLSQLNQEQKALRLVDLLLQREPQNPLFLRRKGQLLLKVGRRAEGLATLKSAVGSAHGDPHIHFEVAEALRAQGAYTDAVEYFQHGLQVDPKSRPGRLALAETLNLAGRYNEVIPVVDALLKEDPNDLSAWKTRAETNRALGRPSEVLYSLRAILLLDPTNGPALLERFRLHLQAGEKPEAFEGLTQVLDLGGAESRDPTLWMEHGDLAADLGRAEDANRSYERAAQLDPGQVAEIATRRARLRLSAGRPDLALEVLDQPVGGVPPAGDRPVPVLLLRAEILMALERPAEAQSVYEEVRKRDPRSPAAVAGVARCLLDQGRHAEARDFLRAAIPQAPPQAAFFLLIAEAETGLGSIPEAIAAVQKGVEALPRSADLWVRLGELYIVKERWGASATAFAHAIALEGTKPELHLRAGFVAEKLGHPNEALALYDHATQIAPSNKFAWCSRGLALLAMGKPEEARASFERALALDADFDAAKEGKKTALQRTREAQIDRHGREALLLEARLNRTVTKNDLFVSLHIPFDLLEPILGALSRNPRIDLDRLTEDELKDLESASYHLVATALDRRPEGIERRGFTLADVAVLSPPTATLDQIQRLFGYLRSVLEADLRPENLRLTPDVEELARRALLLPENQRTLFQLVRTLRVGLFKARLIKAVESAGSAVHAPLPSLDLGAYSPEFRSEEERRRSPRPAQGAEYFAPENDPGAGELAPAPEHAWTLGSGTSHRMAHTGAATGPRCVGCGGIASIMHQCGSPICQHCVAEFHTCPKCQQPVTSLNSRSLADHELNPPASHRQGAAPASHTGGLKGVAARLRPASSRPSPKPAHPADPGHSTPVHEKSGGHAARDPEVHHAPRPPAVGPAESGDPEEEPPKSPPRSSHPRERPDDEPRL